MYLLFSEKQDDIIVDTITSDVGMKTTMRYLISLFNITTDYRPNGTWLRGWTGSELKYMIRFD